MNPSTHWRSPSPARLWFTSSRTLATCNVSEVAGRRKSGWTEPGWANQHNSYFSVSVEPGEHHVCANEQSRVARLSRLVAFTHFTAEAGKVYSFRTRLIVSTSEELLDMDSLDSDEARYLMVSYP